MEDKKDFQKRDNGGYAVVNKGKKTIKHPDYYGKFLLEGKEYYISLWSKEDGMLSFSISDPSKLKANKPANQNASLSPVSGAQNGAPKSPLPSQAAYGSGSSAKTTPAEPEKSSFDDIDDLERLFKDYDQ